MTNYLLFNVSFLSHIRGNAWHLDGVRIQDFFPKYSEVLLSVNFKICRRRNTKKGQIFGEVLNGQEKAKASD